MSVSSSSSPKRTGRGDSFWLHFCGGYIGGSMGVIISHPLDTIRIRFQLEPKKYNNSILNVISQTSRTESLEGFYRGIIPPLLGIGAEKALAFSTFSYVRKVLDRKTESLSDTKKDCIASAVAGAAVASLIITPVESLKINMQANVTRNNLLKTVKSGNLYKGLTATLLRETPGYVVYFSTYNGIKRALGSHVEESFLIGGITGCVTWCVIYPGDVIKSRMQWNQSQFSSWTHCFRDTVATGGYSSLYRGFSLGLLRAFPLHGAAFLGWESFTTLLKKNDDCDCERP